MTSDIAMDDVLGEVATGARRLLGARRAWCVLDADDTITAEPETVITRIPIHDDGAEIGALIVEHDDGGRLTPAHRDLAELLAAVVTAAVRHRRLLERAKLDRSRLDTVNEALPGGIIVRDLDGELLYANRWMREFARRHPFEDSTDAQHPADPAADRAVVLVDEQLQPLDRDDHPGARARRGEHFDGAIVGLPTGDGTTRWLSTSGRPLIDDRGAVLGGLVVVTDVTEQVDVRLRLERSEHLLRDAEVLARSGSWLRDMRTGETMASNGLREIGGIGPDEPIDRDRLYAVFHPDDRTAVFEGTYLAFTEGAAYRDRVRTNEVDGETRLVEISAERFLGPDGEPAGLVGTVRDLTDEFAKEEQLARAERMEMVGRLAGGLAHDFNNLLTVLTGHAELLGATADDRQRESVTAIAAATERAGTLTRQLLEFGRREVLQPRPLDLDDLVAHIEAMARGIVPSSIALAIERSPQRHVVAADPLKIEQVLLNLILNARDALVDRGRITIRTDLHDLTADDAISVAPGRYVRVDVMDDGPGMPPDVLTHAFDPFFTTKPLGTGTGLGLATAQGIIAQSGGELRLSSEPGGGTVASVLLPWSADDPEVQRSAPAEAPPPAGPATILLAEDEDHLRALLERVLTQRGHRVITGTDGLDALEKAASSGTRIDLLVTDVSMPRRNGHELAIALAAVHPQLRVVYMSGYTENSVVVEGLAERGIDFIAKPFAITELTELVDEVLGRPASPA
ncbi:MAG: ATP-binding protein [Ilumatobacteraceae bacterium]